MIRAKWLGNTVFRGFQLLEDFALSVFEAQETYLMLGPLVLIALGGVVAWATGRPTKAIVARHENLQDGTRIFAAARFL